MTKKYRVTLTATEREELATLLARGKADVRKLKHAQVLLHADEAGDGAGHGPGWCDTQIAEAVGVGVATVQRLRQRFVEEGFAAALSTYRSGGRVYERKLDGAQEAHLVALACGTPPDGRARWTLRLLASRVEPSGSPDLVELQHADAVSHETVRQTLKKRPQAAPEADVVHPAQAVG